MNIGMSVDYKTTVFLPKTSFSMRGNLVEKEPKMVERWEQIRLHDLVKEKAKDAEPYILHDGPPYANGQIHLGTALNKILKDVVMRTQRMLGKYVPYVPGWDCHGLPIEWKIEEKYRKAGKTKDDIPVLEFRKECREFALSWLDSQIHDFKRLGVLGDWENPYLTLTPEATSTIVQELGKFLMDGSLYKGFKPVMWSVVEQTALAEMEVEYKDKTSPSIYVGFPIESPSQDTLKGVKAVIWTTTPWTIPANRAICYNLDFDYVVVEITAIPENSTVQIGQCLLLAERLLESFLSSSGLEVKILHRLKGKELENSIAAHPLKAQGYEFQVPLLPGEHVTLEAGTGLVHTAPSHGEDDFAIGQVYDLEVPDYVAENGVYRDHVPLFAGTHVYKADKPVIEALDSAKALLYQTTMVHSYPHSWRSKAPLIFRTTPQWFISMEKTGLRKKAMAAIEETRWIPQRGQNRIASMVKDRPDWCLSRQRVWGVPITVFVHKTTGELLRDQKVHDRIVEAVAEQGADVWYASDPRDFLKPDYNPDDYEPVYDILDVWFDSGSTHAFVLENREELSSPADMYLEGSDQHRGWFQSSLLESCGTRGHAPYKTVLTHGFVLDENGRKMSKSLGNTILPQDITKKVGAEILRLWAVNSDYVEDVRIGQETLKHQQDIYRRLRNTLRYLLGALEGFSEKEKVPYEQMPELEQWVLHQVFTFNQAFKTAGETHDYQKFFTDLHTFCAVDLSAYYFDIRKDALYCDAPDSQKRRAARTVFDILFNHLVCWLSPVLCFTAEEAYLSRWGDDREVSLSLETLPKALEKWENQELAKRFEQVREVRKVITGALELQRNEGLIGSSLQAKVVVYDPDSQFLTDIDWAEQAIISQIDVVNSPLPRDAFTLPEYTNIGVVIEKAIGEKCERCWQILPDVGENTTYKEVCNRCADAVETALKNNRVAV